MKTIARSLLLLAALPCVLASAQTYRYGPVRVALSGTLLSAPGQTPDGEALTFPALRLAAPITVDATPGDTGIDEPTERNVSLLHLALDARTMPIFKRLKGQRATARGTLFHADNGHHQTNVLLSVEDIAPDN
jgi:hypothetical protein